MQATFSVPARGGRHIVLVGLLLLAVLPSGGAVATEQTPDQFTLTATAIGNTSATLGWAPRTEAVGYNVYGARTVIEGRATWSPMSIPADHAAHPLADADPGTWVAVAQQVRDPAVTLTGLPEEGTYAFLVRAVAQDGRELAQSSVAQVSLAEAPGDDLHVEVVSLWSVRLTWEAVPGAARYALLVGNPGRPLRPDPTFQALPGTAVELAGLAPGTRWQFAVVAHDAQGGVLAESQPAEILMPPPPLVGFPPG
jgi:hypothetical protein